MWERFNQGYAAWLKTHPSQGNWLERVGKGHDACRNLPANQVLNQRGPSLAGHRFHVDAQGAADQLAREPTAGPLREPQQGAPPRPADRMAPVTTATLPSKLKPMH